MLQTGSPLQVHFGEKVFTRVKKNVQETCHMPLTTSPENFLQQQSSLEPQHQHHSSLPDTIFMEHSKIYPQQQPLGLFSSQTSPNSFPTQRQACANCQATESPVWRKGNHDEMLCNKCGLYRLRYGKNRPTHVKAGRRQKKSSSKKRDLQVTSEEESDKTCQEQVYTACPSTKKVKTNPSSEKLTIAPREPSFSPDRSTVSCQNSSNGSDLQNSSSSTSSTNNFNELSLEFLENESLFNDLDGHVEGIIPQVSVVENHNIQSSMDILRKQLAEASQRYPLLMNTLISIIRKHVLNQPNVVAMIQSQQQYPKVPNVMHSHYSPILDSLVSSQQQPNNNNNFFMREMEFYSIPQYFHFKRNA